MRDAKMCSLADVLRDGATPDEILEGFQKALEDAKNEVAAEQAKKDAINKRRREANDKLEELRETALDAVFAYLTELFGEEPPEDLREEISDAVRSAEDEFRVKIPFLRMMADIAKMKEEDEKKCGEKCACEKTPMNEDKSPDDIIKGFLKSLR